MMRKRYWVILVISVLIALIGYLVYRLQNQHSPNIDPFTFFPSHTPIVIHTQHLIETHQKLSGASLIWADLTNIPFWSELNKQCTQVHQINKNNPAKKNAQMHCTVGFFPSKDKNHEFLIVWNSLQKDELLELANKLNIKAQIEAPLHGVDIYALNKQKSWYAYSYQHIWVISSSLDILEQSILAYQKKQGLASTNFTSIHKMSAQDADLNLFTNLPESSFSWNKLLDTNYIHTSLKKIGSWAALDLYIKPNILTMSGFIQNHSDSGNSLNIGLQGQKPTAIQVFDYLPKSTLFAHALALSNFSEYRKNIGLKDPIDPLAEKLAPWIENEICYFTFKQAGMIQSGLLLRCLDVRQAWSAFNTSEEKIFTLQDTSFLSDLLGPLALSFNATYVSVVGDYLLISEYSETTDWLTQNKETKTGLSEDVSFQDFLNQFPNTQNMFTYFRPGSYLHYFEAFLSKESAVFTQLHDYFFKKIDFIGIQLTAEKKDLLYANIVLKYGQTKQESPAILWEFAPDEAIRKNTLYVFENHNTQMKEVFFQDQNDQIYLISTTGKLNWKRPLEDSIVGKTYTVDALKNKKKQFLFSTSSKIYLIDRNGKDIPPFPIKLDAKTKLGLQLMDYENNKEYRILVPCLNKMTYNYTIKGQKVEGWGSPMKDEVISHTIKHMVVEKKDYISFVGEKGGLLLTERKGNARVAFSQKINISTNNTYYLVPEIDLSTTSLVYSDPGGNIHRQYLNQKEDIISFKSMSPNHYLSITDWNKDQKIDYILSQDQNIQIIDEQKNILLDYKTDYPLTQAPKIFKIQGVDYLGLCFEKTNQIEFIQGNGQKAKGTPIEGGTMPCLEDINQDGVLDLITTNSSGFIRVYTMPDLKGYAK